MTSTVVYTKPEPNLSVNRTARKRSLRVPSALCAPVAGSLKR